MLAARLLPATEGGPRFRLGLAVAREAGHAPARARLRRLLREAFRALRLNVRYAAPQGHVALGVTSPGPGDGKSLVASNLALAFAQGGWKTVLVDADVRRGHLNETDLLEVVVEGIGLGVERDCRRRELVET